MSQGESHAVQQYQVLDEALRMELLSYYERLRELGLFSLESKDFQVTQMQPSSIGREPT